MEERKHRRGRGRPARETPVVQWKVYISEPIAALVDLECRDPVTGSVKYGERSALLERLLREYYEKRMVSAVEKKGEV